MKKVYESAAAALDGLLFDGMTIAAGGFGLCGIPERLIAALRDEATELTTRREEIDRGEGETGSQAAAKGGFTTIMCMPNTNPVNDNAGVTELILRRAAEAQQAFEGYRVRRTSRAASQLSKRPWLPPRCSCSFVSKPAISSRMRNIW